MLNVNLSKNKPNLIRSNTDIIRLHCNNWIKIIFPIKKFDYELEIYMEAL